MLLTTMFLLVRANVGLAETTVRVGGYAQHVGATIIYRYEVTNNSSYPITSVRIGHHYATDGQMIDERQLVVLPAGFLNIDEGTPAGSKMSPPGWDGEVGLQEENPYHLFRWRRGPNGAQLLPGQKLSGFSVVLPELDFSYLDSFFAVTYSSGPVRTYTARIERLDKTPPQLSISVNKDQLWPPNGKLSDVKIDVAVQDDYDPQPAIALESITSNEVLGAADISGARIGSDDRQFALAAKRDATNKSGRIYTITYSATDASGNKTSASTTVTVPQDQGR